MELHSLQQISTSPNRISEYQKKVDKLKFEVGTLCSVGQKYSPHGRGIYHGWTRRNYNSGISLTGRGRGYYGSYSTNLDRRPCSIEVTGVDLAEKDVLLNHFEQFGEIKDCKEDIDVPSLTFKFKTRRCAEAAMAKGGVFQEKTLSLNWSSQLNQEAEELVQSKEEGGSIEIEDDDDDYTPPKEDYIPPGLEEHENRLLKKELVDGIKNEEENRLLTEVKLSEETDGNVSENELDSGKCSTVEDECFDEKLLDEDEGDEDRDGERSWKR